MAIGITMAPPRGKYQVKLNAVMFAELIGELMEGPCTAQDLADHTGMHLLTVQRTLRPLYRRKLVHISGWEKDAQGRHVIRVFKMGADKDAKRPPPKPRALKKREYVARKALASVGAALAG
jgi:DNA-binding transcriptional ArsR family regulator